MDPINRCRARSGALHAAEDGSAQSDAFESPGLRRFCVRAETVSALGGGRPEKACATDFSSAAAFGRCYDPVVMSDEQDRVAMLSDLRVLERKFGRLEERIEERL